MRLTPTKIEKSCNNKGMKIAIDIDGTIDKSTFLRLLTKEHEVYFLTTRRYSKEQRQEQLKEMGVTVYKDIVIVEGSTTQEVAYNKAMWCKDNGVTVVFEDNDTNIFYIKSYNPKIECFYLYQPH